MEWLATLRFISNVHIPTGPFSLVPPGIESNKLFVQPAHEVGYDQKQNKDRRQDYPDAHRFLQLFRVVVFAGHIEESRSQCGQDRDQQNQNDEFHVVCQLLEEREVYREHEETITEMVTAGRRIRSRYPVRRTGRLADHAGV